MPRKIQTPILTRMDSNYYYHWVADEMESWYFCGFQLHSVFDFPQCEQIQLIAYDQPGAGRTEIKITKSSNGDDDILIIGETETRFIDDGTMMLFKKLAKRRRRWCVTLYYWE